MARQKRGSGTRRRRWPWVLLGLGLLLFVLIGLVLLARPMMDVKPEAEAARDELEMAQDALKAQDVATAKTHVDAARVHVDAASDMVNGIGGDVWRWVPVAGGAVKDARHLVGALDEATSLAEVGTEIYPALMQSDDLVQNTQVDLDQLDNIIEDLNRAGDHLRAAADDLAAVEGNTPFVGEAVKDARDKAQARIDPLRDQYDEAEPVLDALPDMLGQDGQSNYLLAIMNPAEQRYSGGATLTLVPLHMDKGKVEFGDTVTNEDIAAGGANKITWPKVTGNPFHQPGRSRLVSATFSPYWSQSGEELLRAWQARFGEEYDGVVAVDLIALARLMNLTGPVQTEDLGELNSGNLVKVLAGSYDTYPSEEERRQANRAVVPAFKEKLFQGGKFFEKFQLLARASKGRHFAMYFRDPRIQTAFEDRELGGDLSDTTHDYIGVFTQNTNSSKADYWQARKVHSDVKLKADGSADVTLTVEVNNASPPFTPPWADGAVAPPEQDPTWGYYTRWSKPAVAVFLPTGAKIRDLAQIRGDARLGDVGFDPVMREVLGRPYFYKTLTLAPGGKGELIVKYHVPDAAAVDGDSLLYHLDTDQQGMVSPEEVEVVLHLPDGYHQTELPPAWTAVDGKTLKYSSGGNDEQQRFEIALSR